MMMFGAANVLGSVVVGFSLRFCPREVVVGLNSLLHVGLLVVLIICDPNEYGWIMFLVSALWGVCDASWQTQCNCK
jgi:predicted MFS family arabinose efflux permease